MPLVFFGFLPSFAITISEHEKEPAMARTMLEIERRFTIALGVSEFITNRITIEHCSSVPNAIVVFV